MAAIGARKEKMKDEIRSNSSELHKTVFQLVRECYPKESIKQEELIKIDGKQLFIDIYIPRLKLAFECDGIQHEQYSKFFHGDASKFKDQKANDELKNRYCELKNISLVRVRHNDKLNKDVLMDKITQALMKDTRGKDN